jgi:hypothetical protein
MTKNCFNVLGTVAVIAGAVGSKILQKVTGKYGNPVYNKAGELMGHKYDLFDKAGNWSARIDATTHGYRFHNNPHLHTLARDVKQGGISKNVYYFWEVIRRLLGL